MAGVCRVCCGSGRLLRDVCPLCEGDPRFGEGGRRCFVFVLAGQSNMVGRGTSAELDQTLVDFVQVHADVRMAYDIDRSAKEQRNTTSGGEFLPLGHETQWSEGGSCHSHGPEWGIARRVIERMVLGHPPPGGPAGGAGPSPSSCSPAGRAAAAAAPRPRIYLIKFAMGSTSLHEDWRLGGPYFGEFVGFTRAMLRRAAELEAGGASGASAAAPGPAALAIDGLFWNQGDSDASGRSEMRESYEANLVGFVRRVWEDLAADAAAAPPFPFVALQLHWKTDEASKSTKKYRRSMEKVNEAIRSACKKLGSRAGMAELSPELEARLASLCHDDGHSGTAALAIEGRLLADTFAEIMESQGSRRGS